MRCYVGVWCIGLYQFVNDLHFDWDSDLTETTRPSAAVPPPADNGLTYPFSEVPAPAALIEVAPGVNWLRMPLPFALDHINLWLLADGDGWTIVDCGYATDATKDLWRRIFAECLAGRPIKRVIVTHYHPDHVGLAAWLTARFSVELWMPQAEFLTAHAVHQDMAGFVRIQSAELFRRHGVDDAWYQGFTTSQNSYRRGVPELPVQFRRIQDGDAIDINGRAWQVVTGYGHAPEHASLYCAALGVFISGDMLLPRISTNISVWGHEPEGNPLKLFLGSLNRYGTLPPETLVLPSHGRVFTGLHQRIAALERHHAARLAELVAAVTEPVSAAELVPVLFQRVLDEHQMMFAMGETIAHLNYLLHQGKLRRTVGTGGVYRFVRA